MAYTINFVRKSISIRYDRLVPQKEILPKQQVLFIYFNFCQIFEQFPDTLRYLYRYRHVRATLEMFYQLNCCCQQWYQFRRSMLLLFYYWRYHDWWTLLGQFIWRLRYWWQKWNVLRNYIIRKDRKRTPEGKRASVICIQCYIEFHHHESNACCLYANGKTAHIGKRYLSMICEASNAVC